MAPDLPGFSGVPLEAPSADYEPCATLGREVEVRCVIDGDTFSVGRCGEKRENESGCLASMHPRLSMMDSLLSAMERMRGRR